MRAPDGSVVKKPMGLSYTTVWLHINSHSRCGDIGKSSSRQEWAVRAEGSMATQNLVDSASTTRDRQMATHISVSYEHDCGRLSICSNTPGWTQKGVMSTHHLEI